FKGGKIQAANIFFSNISDDDLRRLDSAGSPIWWRVEPRTIASNGTAEVTVRFRKAPKQKEIKITILTTGGKIHALVPIEEGAPKIEGISFSADLCTIYAYVQAKNTPTRILLDGKDITNISQIGQKNVSGVIPVVCNLQSPLIKGAFYTLQAILEDGSTAIGGIRAWADELRYGIWGGRPGKESELEIGKAWINEMAAHNINLQMEMIGSAAVAQFMKTNEGKQLMQSLGIKRIVGDVGKAPSPTAYYLADEPDAADTRVPDVPSELKVGSLAQGLVKLSEEIRAVDPNTPTMVNVDMTFKPNNWYIYGQIADIYAADPYYQTRLAEAYWKKPNTIWKYRKATFVYAVGKICHSACAPRPLHLILNCTRLQEENRKFRFGTPEEKRIEVYYALGAGAKGISFWWFLPIPPNAKGSCGCGADEPEAKALWREIGILGAEVRTAGPLIIRSCPADLQVTTNKNLWVRSLISGLDSVVILCVNDDYYNDQSGTTYKPLDDVELTVALPPWLDPKFVFEINSNGTKELKWERTNDKLKLNLGTVNLTRMIIITSDANLEHQLQQLYQSKFAVNVKKL
ncbi:MAG: hypothetical protein QME62_10515, partial [Armatimonadota bacterium]|nr:hypothetical protein [Armatimonadota bacterium]